RRIRVRGALDVIEQLGTKVGAVADATVLEIHGERKGSEPPKLFLVEDRGRPFDGGSCMRVEVPQLQLADARGIVVPLDDRRPDRAHQTDALLGLGSVADDVADAEDPIHTLDLEALEDGLEGGQVRMDVAEDSVLHRARSGIVGEWSSSQAARAKPRARRTNE